MATIKKQEAVERLAKSVKAARIDDLIEIYNELFPETPIDESDAEATSFVLVDRICRHFANGLEVEEILDLWHVVFPGHRGVWFDEDEDSMHFDEKGEPVGALNG